MTFDPREITERLRLAGENWADREAAASLLEETRKTVLAELMNQLEGSVASRESVALADPSYRLHLVNMVTARKEANRAKVNFDSAKAWIELTRTAESSRRAEMKL